MELLTTVSHSNADINCGFRRFIELPLVLHFIIKKVNLWKVLGLSVREYVSTAAQDSVDVIIFVLARSIVAN